MDTLNPYPVQCDPVKSGALGGWACQGRHDIGIFAISPFSMEYLLRSTLYVVGIHILFLTDAHNVVFTRDTPETTVQQ